MGVHELEIAALNIKYKHHQDDTNDKNTAMIDDRTPVVSLCERQ